MSEAAKTTTILELPDGLRWIRLDDQAAANEESERARHAVGIYFERKRERGDPVSFYSLRDEEDHPFATAMLPSDPSSRLEAPQGTAFDIEAMVTGLANTNPFGPFGEQIEALGTHLGVEIGTHLCPYPGSIERLAEAREGWDDSFPAFDAAIARIRKASSPGL